MKKLAALKTGASKRLVSYGRHNVDALLLVVAERYMTVHTFAEEAQLKAVRCCSAHGPPSQHSHH